MSDCSSSNKSNGEYKNIIQQGLWSNNIILSQSLALCPLPSKRRDK